LDCFHRELSDLLVKQRRYGEAVSVMSNILSKNPSDSKVLLHRGLAYMHLGKASEAVADWERAAELGNADAESEIGRAYMTGIPGVLQPNRGTGIEWFRKSAAQGSAAGKANLAIATAQLNGGP
jgi:TPR repeat protein